MGSHTYTPDMKTELCKGCPSFNEVCANMGTGGPVDMKGPISAHLAIIPFMPTHHAIIGSGSFLDLDKSMLARVIQEVQRTKFNDLKVYYSYAVRTVSKPTKDHIKHCSVLLKKELGGIQPAGAGMDLPIFVTAGSEPLKSLGLPVGKVEKVFGRSLDYTLLTPMGEKKTKIYPLVSPKKLSATPGLIYQVEKILEQAVKDALGLEKEAVPISYQYPKTPAEVAMLIQDIFNYQRNKISPLKWTISIDTETNTLHPYAHPDPKLLMISIGWDEGKSATILLDHPDHPYSPADRDEIFKHLRWLLESDKPKVFHNYKFDLKFLEFLHKLKINNVKWDTMLGEHFLDEDKKDVFSLKTVGPIYAPAYQAYDDELKAYLRNEKEESDLYTDAELLEMFLEGSTPEDITDADDEEKLTKWNQLGELLAEQVRLREDVQTKTGEKKKLSKAALTRTNKAVRELKASLKLHSPKKKKDKGFEDVPLDTVLEYAATDGDVTWQVLRGQVERVGQEGTMNHGIAVMRSLYIPASRTIAGMEWRGFAIDRAHMKSLEKEASTRAKQLTQDLIGLAGAPFNPNSPPQTFKTMFERMGFTAIEGVFTESTNKKAMDLFVHHYPLEDPRGIFAEKLIQYREANQVLKTINKNIKKNMMGNRIHCQFHLNGTTTGRLSSSKPNMQNIPSISGRRVREIDGKETILYPGYNIKKLFVPSKPNHLIVSCDISGAELRTFTAYAPDDELIAAMNEDKDIHSFTASKIYGIPYDEIVAKKKYDLTIAKYRKIAKVCVFCTLYGGGPKKISEQAGITIEEAKQVQAFLFQAFPKIQEYITGVKEEIRHKRKVNTLFGRYRRFPNLLLDYDNSKAWNDAYREAVNFKIQSTSSDLVMSQLIEIDEHAHEIEGELLLTVHDSYVLQVPEQSVNLLYPFFDKYITQRVQEKFSFLPVKFAYDLEVGPSYGETEALDRPKERTPE